jgi:hypothetical protein
MTSRITSLLIFITLFNTGFSQVPGISSSNLPLVVINTNGKTIIDASKIQATMKLIFNGDGKINQPTDPGNIYTGNIGIEIRGSYSASLPQKPYGIETRDISGNNLDVSILGMPEENDWILLANYNDKTFMRNVLAFDLFRKMGHYAPRTRLVEVIVNNEYQGVYVLTEKIKQDKGRVDIAKLATKDISGDDVTGGYIFKIDYYDQWNSWQSSYTPVNHPEKVVNYVYADPDPDKLMSQQKTYLKEAVNSFESVLYGSAFADKTKGYPAWIDANSFIDYFIVSEVSRNVDAFKKSCYFYKDKNSKGGKIIAGPVWDFDWAWKNIRDCATFQATNGSGWSYKINECPNIWPNSNGWTVRLLQDPNFANALNKRYFELRNSFLSISTLNHFIDSVQNLASEAQVRHYAKWNILSQSVGAPEVDSQPSTYAGQVTKFKNWIQTRIKWLDANMLGKSTTGTTDEFQANFSYRIFPNPASEVVYLEASTEIQEVELFNTSGKSMLHRPEISAFSTKIDISNITPGIYLIKMKVKGKSDINSKLVVQ